MTTSESNQKKVKTLRMICLANSRKISGRCIAGKDADSLAWIRPVSNRSAEEISEEERQFKDGKMPAVLDILRIAVIGEKSNFFQTENVLINPQYYWSKTATFPKKDLLKIIDKPDSLWENGYSSYYGHNDRVPANNMAGKAGSLYLINPSALEILVQVEGVEFGGPGKRKVRAKFYYRKKPYTFTVTDPEVEKQYLAKKDAVYRVDNLEGRVFMCVSMGLPYEDNFCYKFVASIIGQ
jgi:hypothetical protein